MNLISTVANLHGVSHYTCAQETTTVTSVLRGDRNQFAFTNTVLNICSCFFWNIYWSSQNPLKTLSVFPPLHHVLLKSLGFVLPWASLMLFSLEFKIESRAWTEDTIVCVQNCIIIWFVSLHCYVHYGQIIIIFSDYSVFRTLQFYWIYWVLVAMLTFFFLLLLRNLDLCCTRCCTSGDKSKSPFS